MCTVTYIPRSDQSFTLTSNRDENAERASRELVLEERLGQELLFPRDGKAGGTWIAAANSGRIVCLLNGAFDPYHRKPPYRRSRGLMVLDFFDYPDASHFLGHYKFEGMEPFTMILLERGRLIDFRWDGQARHVRHLEVGRPWIWASTTLYDQEARGKRQKWFDQWLKGRKDFSQEAILDFHLHAGDGDPWNDVVMNREGLVQTVSITSITNDKRSIYFRYEDLYNGA